MSEEKDERKKSQGDWLREHEMLQLEISKMKDDLISEFSEPEGPPKKGMPTVIPAGNAKARDEEMIEGGNRDQFTSSSTRQTIIRPPPIEEVEKRFPKSGGGLEVQKELETPPKAEGQMPRHPGLSKFIARVLEHDDKVARKKFKGDKKGKGVKIPSEKPYRKKDNLLVEREDGGSEGVLQGEYMEMIDKPELKKRDGEKNEKTWGSEGGPDASCKYPELYGEGKGSGENIIVPVKRSVKLATPPEGDDDREDEEGGIDTIDILHPPRSFSENSPYGADEDGEHGYGFFRRSYIRFRRTLTQKKKTYPSDDEDD